MSEKIVKKTMAVPVEVSLLSKKNCLSKAEKILQNGEITGMSATELAAEIYFHACISAISKPLAAKNIPVFTWLAKHADPIDLESGGDKPFRKLIFRLYWLLPEIH